MTSGIGSIPCVNLQATSIPETAKGHGWEAEGKKNLARREVCGVCVAKDGATSAQPGAQTSDHPLEIFDWLGSKLLAEQ